MSGQASLGRGHRPSYFTFLVKQTFYAVDKKTLSAGLVAPHVEPSAPADTLTPTVTRARLKMFLRHFQKTTLQKDARLLSITINRPAHWRAFSDQKLDNQDRIKLTKLEHYTGQLDAKR